MVDHSGRWRAADIGVQTGRTALITGANNGIGFEAALQLAARGAMVVLACRDAGRATDAAARIGAAVPGASLATLQLDLASLASVRVAAERFRSDYDRLDLLINNAGVMIPPYGTTADGFELQFGVNHLGHFALTGLLLDLLLPVPGSRIVTVSSNAHRRGVIDFDDLQSERRYRRVAAYAQSKLANLLFTYELQRRLGDADARTIAVAAHPGNAYTDLARHASRFGRILMGPHLRLIYSRFIQSAHMGALPTLRAAADPQVRGGEYYGPGGWGEFTGYPVRVESVPSSHNEQVQQRLWDLSQRLTGVDYRFAQQAV